MIYFVIVLAVGWCALAAWASICWFRCEEAEDRALRAEALAEGARRQLRGLADQMKAEREASDQRVDRARETAKAAAAIEARLMSDDVDEVADAINESLSL